MEGILRLPLMAMGSTPKTTQVVKPFQIFSLFKINLGGDERVTSLVENAPSQSYPQKDIGGEGERYFDLLSRNCKLSPTFP